MHFAVVALRCDTVWPPHCLASRTRTDDGREEEKERRDMILIPEEEGGVRRGYSGVKIYLDTI